MSDARLVVVGYGMGAYHARLIKETPELNLYGICDVQQTQRDRAKADYPEAVIYGDYKDVLADKKVDVVVVVTPHSMHAEMAIEGMNAGKHVITDKAMCLTVADAEAMIAARDRNQVLLTTFHNRRWDSDFITVRKVVEEGLIGRLYHIQSTVTSFGNIGGWRNKRELMGGWMYDWGAHTVDQILLLANSKPMRVYAFSHFKFTDPGTVEDYINCTITFESGLTATTIVGYLNHIEMDRWYVMGETGSLRGENFEKPVQSRTTVNGVKVDMTIPLIKGDWGSFYRNFADALAARTELAVKPEQLLPQIAIAEAAYRSIETGQTQAP